MDRNTFIDKIKTLFSEVEKDVEEKLKDVTTIDGINLRIKEDEIAEGVEVFVVGEDGEETPAPDGEHNIGDKIITTAEGKVVSIVDVDEETEAEEEKKEEVVIEEEMNKDDKDKKKEDEEVEAEDEDKKKKEDEYEEEVDPLEKRIESLEKAIANIAESMSAVDNLSEVVSKIANLPADEEVKLSKSVSGKSEKTNTREDKLRFLSKRK
tara:strand:+ start:16834 stop:17460 length:627 start_codon:yes stop_codon:yes gene_type:complete